MRALAVLLVVGCGRINFEPVATACDPDAVTITTVVAGELVLSGIEAEQSTGGPRALDRTILFTTVREAEPSPTYGQVMCELLDTGSVRCMRTMAGTDYAASTGTITVRYAIVEAASGVTVQRGRTMIGGSTLVPIAPVSLDESFVLLGGGSENVGASWGTNEFVRAHLVDDRTLELTSLSGGETHSWQVVTMTGARVQRGRHDMATGDVMFDATHEPVDLGRALPLISYTYDSGIELGNDDSLIGASLTSATNLHVFRAGGAAPAGLAWQVIELPFAVTTGSTTLAPGESTATEPLDVSDRAVAVAHSQPLLGPCTGAVSTELPGELVDLIGEAAVTFTTSPQQLVLERASAAGVATIPWSVIDFGAPCSGP